jgi:hypothetical protein
MFDITGQDISLLSDEDLRALIGRLCEAELRRGGLSPVAVTWGGNQNAADGGIDVRVAAETAIPSSNAIPRSHVGYQVKAEDMPRGKISEEMRPGGLLRASIQELADLAGSYIIVSSEGSVSNSAMRERKRAMGDAVADLRNAKNLHLDFYDRDRLATWVRDHAGIVTWVRERIGRPISGWRPYEDWAGSREGVIGVYLVDDELRIQSTQVKGDSLPALDGIERIRAALSEEPGIVRLVGLSGTGKTRLAQALFDDRVGAGALALDLAIYTNLSDDPIPQPVAVATELFAQKRRQVLVIDNCTPELHGRLAEVCGKAESRLSLLTIEYDVREDQPEGTDVFVLQPSSDDLIEKLLLRRVVGLSPVNAASIARFASGNARVALALADTIESGESVASLKNADLFERLFRQRHESSNSLLLSAQACSLAYSFQGEDLTAGEHAEISKLAAVVGKDVRSLHADIAELRRRDLVQQRGVWRALLPHAIANRLAAMALENILPDDLDQLFATAPIRLLRSISRRLGYLHKSQAAQKIVRKWLADGGLLGRIEALNEDGRAMLANVAPVAPVATLDAIERSILRRREAGAQLIGEEFRTLLLSLAFDPELFDRSVNLILMLIEFEKPGRFANQVRNSFPSLFHLYLSGTHATVPQRVAVIDDLLRSDSETRRELGFGALEAMLLTFHFSSFQRFDFGGRSRDFGWFPRSRQDVLEWYVPALALCASHDQRDDKTSSRIRIILSKHLRGLWSDFELYDEVDEICRRFHEANFWPGGWTAIRSIRRYRKEPLPEEEDARLSAIEKLMAPQSLAEQVRGRVLRNLRDSYDDIDYRDYEAQFARREKSLIELGKTMAGEAEVLDGLMPELFLCSTGITLGAFAKGLIDATSDRRALWNRLVASYGLADAKERSPELLACYLFNLQSLDPELVETLLDEMSNEPLLSEWLPAFQGRVSISSDGLARLKESLANRSAPAERYRGLGWSSKLDESALLELVPMILLLPDGFDVALNMLWLRMAQEQREKKDLSPEVMAAGRLVLEACQFDHRMNREAHELQEVIEACLGSPEGVSSVEKLLDRLKLSHSMYGLGFMEENRILGALIAAQPLTVLNRLFASGNPEDKGGMRGFFDHDELIGSPLDRVPQAIMLAWCDEDRAVRYALIAARLCPFNKSHNSDVRQWKELALALLEHAPDKIEVLKQYIYHLRPMSWSGSRSASWEANAKLLDVLKNHADLNLAEFARVERESLRAMLDDLRRQELASEKRENERFE